MTPEVKKFLKGRRSVLRRRDQVLADHLGMSASAFIQNFYEFRVMLFTVNHLQPPLKLESYFLQRSKCHQEVSSRSASGVASGYTHRQISERYASLANLLPLCTIPR